MVSSVSDSETRIRGLLGLGFWVQGFRCFPWLAVNFFLKDGLNVDPSTLQLLQNSANFPMVGKPFYGVLSDAVYISGQHRIPYIAIAILQAISWLAIAIFARSSISIFSVTLYLLLSNLGASIAEVANDAIVAEIGKQPTTTSKNSQKTSSVELQSFVWIASSAGGVIGNLLGGIAISRFSPQTMFLFFGLVVALQFLLTLSVRESSLGLPKSSSSNGIGKQLSKLILTLQKPQIAYSVVWLAASYAMIPALTGTMFFYQRQFLKIDSSVVGISKVFGQAAMLLWSVIYNYRLKSVPARKLIIAMQYLLGHIWTIQQFSLQHFSCKMKPGTNRVSRGQKAKESQGEGPNWVLIAGSALLSTLSIRLGYKLKQSLDSKKQANTSNGNGKLSDRRRSPSRMHSHVYSFSQEDDDGCFNCISGNEGIAKMKHSLNDHMLSESDVSLPLVPVSAPECSKENVVTWVSSPDRLELPPKPFHHSNCSDSPCVSESGSDIFSKREVIQKLRQQLKRRDDMIMEMQDQIMELQTSLNSQLALSTNLQSQLDTANRELFDSEREIQRLRKVIADHCVTHVGSNDKTSTVTIWPSEARNGHANGFVDRDLNVELPQKGKGDSNRIDMLKREVGDLKEVIEGKEFLLQSYKEQKAELSMKIKELQQRLDSQLPNIL